MKNKIVLCILSVILSLNSCHNKPDHSDQFDLVNISPEVGYQLKEEWKDVNLYYTYHFTGKIDNKYAFDMNLKVFGNKISGTYNYLNYEAPIDIEGRIDDTYLEFTEKSGHVFTGTFDYSNGSVTGHWTNNQTGISLPFSMVNPQGKGYPKKTYKIFVTEKSYSSDTYYVKLIQETDQEDNILTIPIDSQLWESESGDKFDLYLEDYNFDGYLDICAFHYLPSKYMYLIYDPHQSEYIENHQYDQLYAIVLATNFRKKLLYEYTDHQGVQKSIFQYNSGKLVQIYKSFKRNAYDGNFLSKMYYRYINGEQRIINAMAFKELYGQKVLDILKDD